MTPADKGEGVGGEGERVGVGGVASGGRGAGPKTKGSLEHIKIHIMAFTASSGGGGQASA